jgi:hypothetical protein
MKKILLVLLTTCYILPAQASMPTIRSAASYISSSISSLYTQSKALAIAHPYASVALACATVYVCYHFYNLEDDEDTRTYKEAVAEKDTKAIGAPFKVDRPANFWKKKSSETPEPSEAVSDSKKPMKP